ncbi:hypothetical protein AB0E25_33125 [Streptomyces bobili]|uniref:hypothetical protein n=1 Tax=Streptomyces bobili TaxID=67280 RepID=UPI0033CD1008
MAVNTRDDRCWVRRGWTPAGHGLYALEGSPQDAEQTLYLIRDLAEFGLRSMAHLALPVPAGSDRADGITRRLAPTQALREDEPLVGRARLDASAARDAEATHWRRLEIEDPHDGPLHHTYRVPRDLPEPAGVQTSGACKACGSAPDSWCPDCGACQRGCYDGFVDNSCSHAGASWVGVE